MALSPLYADYKEALNSVKERICRELGLYYDANYNLVIKIDKKYCIKKGPYKIRSFFVADIIYVYFLEQLSRKSSPVIITSLSSSVSTL